MFMQFLGVPIIYPTRLFVDNAAVVLHTSNAIRRFTPASKAHDIEQKYLVDAAVHQVVEVCDIDGKINPSDMMTKVATVTMTASIMKTLEATRRPHVVSTWFWFNLP